VLRGVLPAELYGTAPEKKSKAARKTRAAEKESVPSDEGTPLNADGKALFEHLRSVRREIAEENNVPAFMVFSDKTLRAMARQRPTSKGDLLKVHGVGFAKLEAFGDRFMKEIRDFRG
jgi:ATP-dependent DNA helicase RecQ